MKRTLLLLALTLSLPAHATLPPLGIKSASVQQIFSVQKMQPKGELTVTQTEQTAAENAQIVYTTQFTNNTLKDADTIDIVNPIPKDAVYLPDSATGSNCDIMFSVDGGETWDKAENLLIAQTDGSQRPAYAADYTHIRWVYTLPLAPKASSQVSFAVKVY